MIRTVYIYVHAIFIEQVIAKGLEKRNEICARQIGTHLLICLGDDFEPIG